MTVCDGKTFDTSKLVETDMTRGNYTGTLMYPLYDASHTCQWYYLSRQEPEDVLLFKSFDSKEDSIKCEYHLLLGQWIIQQKHLEAYLFLLDIPHTSFTLPSVQDQVAPRISVEIRALVFTNEPS